MMHTEVSNIDLWKFRIYYDDTNMLTEIDFSRHMRYFLQYLVWICLFKILYEVVSSVSWMKFSFQDLYEELYEAASKFSCIFSFQVMSEVVSLKCCMRFSFQNLYEVFALISYLKLSLQYLVRCWLFKIFMRLFLQTFCMRFSFQDMFEVVALVSFYEIKCWMRLSL